MTYLEKLIQEKPEYYEQLSEHDQKFCLFGCPCSHGFEISPFCPSVLELDLAKYGDRLCVACWNREIPEEKPEDQIDLTMKGEKKMKLAELIRDTVLNSICDRDIEEAVKDAFEEYDYSDLISRAVEDYLYCNVEDIANDIVVEAVRDYMAENL